MNNLNLYRGSKDIFCTGEFPNKYLDQARRPLNTPDNIHFAADNWFYNEFGYKFRSQALFCTGSEKIASGYGSLGIIEPIGKHAICWSPIVSDLYCDYQLAPNEATLKLFLESAKYSIFTIIDDELLQKALLSGHEIMLWCINFRFTKV